MTTSPVYVPTKELPQSVKDALKSVGYDRRDIGIVASETVSVGQGGGDGRRSFYAIVSLDGLVEPKVEYGSWGGANPFEMKRVDHDQVNHPIHPGYAVIVGSESGGTRVYATMHLHPSNLAPLLPAKAEISDRLRGILKDFVSLTSAGRKAEWEIYNTSSKPTSEELETLIGMDLLKKNKAGAVSITTKGKNEVSV
jgi:hypothetical protein